MKVLLIIPCYNEEKNIEKLISNINTNYSAYDYIIINDCSTDNTETICKRNSYNYISLCTNLGIGGGVQTGYMYAMEKDYDIAIQLDGDGQHDPAFLSALVQTLEENQADMVIGSRFIKNEGFQTSFLRRMGIKIINQTIQLCCGLKITDATSGFRACSKSLIQFFAENYAHDYPEPEAIVSAVLNNYSVKEIPVIMHERNGGTSSITRIKSVYYMAKVVLALLLQRLSTFKLKRKDCK